MNTTHPDVLSLRRLRGPVPEQGERNDTLHAAAFALGRQGARNHDLLRILEEVLDRWSYLGRDNLWARYDFLLSCVRKVRREGIMPRHWWMVLDPSEDLMLLRRTRTVTDALKWVRGPHQCRQLQKLAPIDFNLSRTAYEAHLRGPGPWDTSQLWVVHGSEKGLTLPSYDKVDALYPHADDAYLPELEENRASIL